ncbi:MAG: hypothetical protein U0529_15800 [Thermoanaerobaculia bacterium]
MARTGIRILETRVAFVEAVIALHKGWTRTGMDAQRRAQAVIDAANTALGTYKVPKVTFGFTGQSSAFAAELDHRDWRIDLDRRAFDSPGPPSNAHMSELVDSVYHESRHAEQWFLAARYRIGEGWSTDQLIRNGLKRSVAVAAAFAPMVTGSPEEGLAKRLAESLMTDAGFKRLAQTQKDMEVLADGSTATAKEKEDAFKRLQALGYLKGKYDPGALQWYAHKAYQSQFPETDAWDTGRLAAELYLRLAHLKIPPQPVQVLVHV